MSDTPRTDWLAERNYSRQQVPADFARELEREVIALRKAIGDSCEDERSMVSEGHTTCGLARELERENARLRETLNRTHRAYLCMQGVNEKQAAKTADAMFQVSLPNA